MEKMIGTMPLVGYEPKFYENSKSEILVVSMKERKQGQTNYNFFKEVIKVWELKDIYAFFMLHLNEDFDDDLLQDVIEILIE